MSANLKANNIIIIHADQHRYDCIGAYGNKEIKTPNLDRLAKDSVVYENSVTAYPVCTPSRYSFLCGLPVYKHQGWTNKSTLKKEIETFPRVLQRNNYKTTVIGKCHFKPTYLDVGFDEMILAEQNGDGRWEDDYHRDLMDNDLCDVNDVEDQVHEGRQAATSDYFKQFGTKVSNLPDEFHSTTWIGNKAVENIKQWTGGKKLLSVNFIKPHHPFDPPRSYLDQYDPDSLTPLPGWTENMPDQDINHREAFFKDEDLNEGQLKKIMAAYYAGISHIDDATGKIIDLLKEKKLYDDCMIIYTSDHGDYMGHHHKVLKKGYLYDPLLKVPLIIKYPGNSITGYSKELVNNTSLAKTIIDGSNLDQEYVKPADMEPGIKDSDGEFVYSCSQLERQRMIRGKRYKLILLENEDTSLFFDLEDDPAELKNVYHQEKYGEIIADYRNKLKDYFGEYFSSGWDNYCNESEPVIAGPNVLKDDRLKVKLKDYFLEKFGKLYP